MQHPCVLNVANPYIYYACNVAIPYVGCNVLQSTALRACERTADCSPNHGSARWRRALPRRTLPAQPDRGDLVADPGFACSAGGPLSSSRADGFPSRPNAAAVALSSHSYGSASRPLHPAPEQRADHPSIRRESDSIGDESRW